MGRRSGSRFWPSTPPPLLQAPKAAFLSVAGQLIVGHLSISPLRCSIVLVVGYMGERIGDWVEQKKQLGLEHAIAQTRAVANDDGVRRHDLSCQTV